MTSFQIALDRYLTTEPPDDFTPYWEQVANHLPAEIWDKIENEETEAFREKREPVSNRLVWYCFTKDFTPERTAGFLSRIYAQK